MQVKQKKKKRRSRYSLKPRPALQSFLYNAWRNAWDNGNYREMEELGRRHTERFGDPKALKLIPIVAERERLRRIRLSKKYRDVKRNET